MGCARNIIISSNPEYDCKVFAHHLKDLNLNKQKQHQPHHNKEKTYTK